MLIICIVISFISIYYFSIYTQCYIQLFSLLKAARVFNTRSSAIAKGLCDVLVSRNPATTKHLI